MKQKSKVGMARGPVLHRQKQSSCIKTKLKCCTMTESLWNKYYFSRKSPEVPVKRLPKVVRKERALVLNILPFY